MNRPSRRRTMSVPIVDRLFVYGTLRVGQTARSLIANHVARWVPASVSGAIYAFPMGYPGFVEPSEQSNRDAPEGRVIGELVWLTDLAAAFALLDAFEGADFVRVLRPCRLADGSEQIAWCYLLADPRTTALATPIKDGDWVAYWRASVE